MRIILLKKIGQHSSEYFEDFSYTLFFKECFLLAHAEYSYFWADFWLKIFSYYSCVADDISILEYIGVSIIVSAGFLVLLPGFTA